MSTRKRRKSPRTRRLDGGEAAQRQAIEASRSFWHGAAPAETGAEPQAASDAQSRLSSDGVGELLSTARRISVTPDPTSTVRSLGKPPLNGRETVAEHYFEAVYTRAVAMAGALAAAGGLLEETG